MPNHVTNRITFDGSETEIQKLLQEIQYDPNPDDPRYTGIGTFDFNKVVPMPESLHLEASSVTYNGVEVYLTAIDPDAPDYGVAKTSKPELYKILDTINRSDYRFLRKPPLTQDQIDSYTKLTNFSQLVAVGRQAVDNMVKYGSFTWYDWSIKNWGTKWNSYDAYNTSSYDGYEMEFNTAWSAPHPVIDALAKKYPNVYIIHEWVDESIGENCGIWEYSKGKCVRQHEFGNRKECIDFAARFWGEDPIDYNLVLNATEDDYLDIDGKSFDLIELFGKPALFTSDRLRKSEIPKGTFLYHVRGDDETTGGFASLQKSVFINHFGSIITKEPVDLGPDGIIEFTKDTEPKFTGKTVNFEKFLFGNE